MGPRNSSREHWMNSKYAKNVQKKKKVGHMYMFIFLCACSFMKKKTGFAPTSPQKSNYLSTTLGTFTQGIKLVILT